METQKLVGKLIIQEIQVLKIRKIKIKKIKGYNTDGTIN
jgi:hypothetical protein